MFCCSFSVFVVSLGLVFGVLAKVSFCLSGDRTVRFGLRGCDDRCVDGRCFPIPTLPLGVSNLFLFLYIVCVHVPVSLHVYIPRHIYILSYKNTSQTKPNGFVTT